MKFNSLFTAAALLLVWGASAQCEFTELTLETTTAEWGAEVSWELYQVMESGDALVASYQGVEDFATSSETLCLEDGCYYLLALDSWGDGWNGTEVSCTPAIPGFALPFTLFEDSYGFLSFELGEVGCQVVLEGCTDWDALNYVQGANTDDGSCVYAESFDSMVNGVSTTREYIYYAPEGMADNAPLVFVLHGYFGTAEGMYDISGFRELADQEGFGVVWPQGLPDGNGNNHWNANFDWGSETDAEFLVQLAQHLQAEHNHAAGCTYSCGYSNGGYMSYSLACRAADTFRGIGSVGGTMTNNDWESCTPVEQVPVVHIHGTQDETILYNGTDNWQFGWGQQPGVESIVAWWAEQNNCDQVEETSLPNLDPTDGSDVDLIRHHGGDNGYEARVYRVNGGGHDWFGAWGNMDISSAVEMWNFWQPFCAETADVDPAPSPEQALFDVLGSSVRALQPCEVQVVDVTGRTRLRRPVQPGQTVDLSGLHGVHLLVARTRQGIQSEKVLLGGFAD
ncbi:alpha/beta hydrolase-fold protein [Flavobacteriales bacterium]|nr:alpha/beta hydrolase-fold protein [Flavobacteriales bacterium]